MDGDRRFGRLDLLLLSTVFACLLVPLAEAHQNGPHALKGVRPAKAPVIDGIVGAEEWTNAPVAGEFIQFEPHRGEPSPLKTEALVLYAPTCLYVAFRLASGGGSGPRTGSHKGRSVNNSARRPR